MGATISSIFNYEESKNEKYSNILNSLNKISKTIDDTQEMINDIEVCIKNQNLQASDMEWDYYDAPILEIKKLPKNLL